MVGWVGTTDRKTGTPVDILVLADGVTPDPEIDEAAKKAGFLADTKAAKIIVSAVQAMFRGTSDFDTQPFQDPYQFLAEFRQELKRQIESLRTQTAFPREFFPFLRATVSFYLGIPPSPYIISIGDHQVVTAGPDGRTKPVFLPPPEDWDYFTEQLRSELFYPALLQRTYQ